MSTPHVYEHYRPPAGGYPDGIYRVVGTPDGQVTLLRVGDSDGRRVNTGEVITVNADEFEGFIEASNPDGNRSATDVLISTLESSYWSVRAFLQQLAARPHLAAIALALLLTGAVGDQFLPFPETVFTGLVVVGTLVLVAVASGRL
jgi:hypothetical protein